MAACSAVLQIVGQIGAICAPAVPPSRGITRRRFVCTRIGIGIGIGQRTDRIALTGIRFQCAGEPACFALRARPAFEWTATSVSVVVAEHDTRLTTGPRHTTGVRWVATDGRESAAAANLTGRTGAAVESCAASVA